MKNNRTLLIILITVIALFIGAIVFVPQLTKKSSDDEDGTSTVIDISEYDVNTYIEGNEDNGGISDHVRGADIKTAKVILFEYADYQCSGCATVTPWIGEVLEDYKDEVAIVYRSLPLTSIHPNAIAAASAVEAAGLQGYWEEYADLVFANQAEWFYATGSKRTEYFASYFNTVTNGAGDVNKFRSDMAGDAVKAKVNFDRALAESLNITGTPTFFNSKGQELDWASGEQTKAYIQNYFRNYFNKALGREE
ncbi:thioredoxin domain-containing protein [Candidatus Saccharibacteria bacterium]|nr:thioredoxin domain-containing protein [Candidatus Saccharibacteria bacterium]